MRISDATATAFRLALFNPRSRVMAVLSDGPTSDSVDGPSAHIRRGPRKRVAVRRRGYRLAATWKCVIGTHAVLDWERTTKESFFTAENRSRKLLPVTNIQNLRAKTTTGYGLPDRLSLSTLTFRSILL